MDLPKRVKRRLGVPSAQLAFDISLDVSMTCQVHKAVHDVVLRGGFVIAIPFAKLASG
jgi:hypothetical protein